MVSRVLKSATATAGAAAIAGCGPALAAGGPPPPTSSTGNKVRLVAQGGGIGTPTSFAFGAGSIFDGDAGPAQTGPPNGGVFVLKRGTAIKLAGSPPYVAGLAWHQGALYVSGGKVTTSGNNKFQILRWSGWNGTRFAHRKIIYTAPKKLAGLNGIAFGPDGRLYVGAGVGPGILDHGPASEAPYLYTILSMNTNGKSLKVYATGIRQPWQLAFSKGSAAPLVSDLGQDQPANLNPPDFLLRVKQGDNYGFPKCNRTPKSNCKGFARPFRTFAPHLDIMGLAIIGKTLYMTSFTGTTGKAGEVFSMPLSGGPLKPLLTGFVAPTVGLGANGAKLYVGELTGQVFSVRP